MKRCVILDDYQGVALRFADWDRLADRVSARSISEYIADPAALAQRIGDAEIVVAMRERTKFTAQLIGLLPRLELLVTSGMKNAAIDLAATKAHGIEVCGTGGSSAPPMELSWALILGLARHIVPENIALRDNGPWQSTVGVDLAGKQLGILGLGNIGTAMAKVGQAFGMSVVAWSPNLTDEKAAAAGVAKAASKEALLEASDVVTIHLVLAPTTRGLVGEAELRRMKPSAFLINTSRAPIVDEPALIRALDEGWVAGAGLDVFEAEPLAHDHPYRRMPNVLATPHIGYVSENNYRQYFTEAVEDITAWLDGSAIRTLG